MLRNTVALTLTLVALLFAGAAQAQSDYDVGKIIEIMSGRGGSNQELTLICAHRGYWRDVPENTLQAVEAALAMNVETVELDVRLTRDGVPVLMHDWALNRTTTGKGFVADVTAVEISRMFRRDGAGQATRIPVPSLRDALIQLYEYNANRTTDILGQRGYVLVLDVKDKHDARAVDSYAAARAAWDVIAQVQREIVEGRLQRGDGKDLSRLPRINIAEAIVIKVLARELPRNPSEYQETMAPIYGAGAKLFPILYFQDLRDRSTPEGREHNSRWDAYLAAGSRGTTSVVSFEVVRPYPDLAVSAAYDAQLQREGRFRSGFAPWNDYPEGTSMGTGACCRDREPSAAARDPNFTGSWEYIASLEMNMITSDRPDILDAYLQAIGRRNLTLIR